jgi:U3 small nucleolar RNA-associated protein 19
VWSAGGLVSVLALDGIWYLMRNHNLDYPEFYTKLYSLVTVETLQAEFRSTFLQKLDMFMSSASLASDIAAAFAKR